MAPQSEFDIEIARSVELMRARAVVFEHGLSDAEVEGVETSYGFRFPPDLRAFLQTALPVSISSDWGSDAFPNWRSGDGADLQRRLDWPFEGIAFDIENNAFWHDDWGQKPSSLEEALAVARQAVVAAPKLIPICSHRYLPMDPLFAGNPVLSVYQTDIIYSGHDLWDYFVNEFAPDLKKPQTGNDTDLLSDYRPVRFWSYFLE